MNKTNQKKNQRREMALHHLSVCESGRARATRLNITYENNLVLSSSHFITSVARTNYVKNCASIKRNWNVFECHHACFWIVMECAWYFDKEFLMFFCLIAFYSIFSIPIPIRQFTHWSRLVCANDICLFEVVRTFSVTIYNHYPFQNIAKTAFCSFRSVIDLIFWQILTSEWTNFR